MFPSRLSAVFTSLALLAVPALAPAQATAGARPIPKIDRTGVHPTLLVENAPYLVLGTQVNNSSAFAASLPQVWPAVEKLGVNTVEAPIYWECVEPTEGKLDFSSVDLLLTQARQHHVHLILLWFGTWKNGSPGYTPAWIKQDQQRFPLAVNAAGRQFFSLTPFGEQTLAADKRTFTALMQHLSHADPQRTVLMVQVENESGMWGNSRDHSPAADKAFNAPVPADVLAAMGKQGATGSWGQVFGKDADNFFYGWAIARYINQVAEAGKRAYPLPMYVNAALKNPLHDDGPGSFESGGPVFDALPIWHLAAPAIDLIGPDIYSTPYAYDAAVLKQYATPWNPLMVPEIGNSTAYARYLFAALGQGALGWTVFGMDQTGYSNYPLGAEKIDDAALAPFALNFSLFAPMQGVIARLNGEGNVRASAENPDVHTETLTFGPAAHWSARVSYGQPSFYSDKPAPGNARPEGGALVAQLGPDEFLVTGVHSRVDFDSATPGKQRMWLQVQEGNYVRGAWVPARIWNGDQTDYGLNFTGRAQVLRVKLLAY